MEKVCKAGQHGESLSPKGEFEGGADNREVIMRAGGVRTKILLGYLWDTRGIPGMPGVRRHTGGGCKTGKAQMGRITSLSTQG